MKKEHTFHSIFDCLNKHGIINPNQARTFLSDTAGSYFLLIKFFKLCMYSHSQVNLLLLNFFKAFDTVAHNKFFLKLGHCDTESNTHQWTATWLTAEPKEF